MFLFNFIFYFCLELYHLVKYMTEQKRNVKKKKLTKYIYKISVLEKEKIEMEVRKYGSSFALLLLKDLETNKSYVLARYDKSLDTIGDLVNILEYIKDFGLSAVVELDDVILRIQPKEAINFQIIHKEKVYNISIDIEKFYERLRRIWANL